MGKIKEIQEAEIESLINCYWIKLRVKSSVSYEYCFQMLRYKFFYLDQTWTILEKVKVFICQAQYIYWIY